MGLIFAIYFWCYLVLTLAEKTKIRNDTGDALLIGTRRFTFVRRKPNVGGV